MTDGVAMFQADWLRVAFIHFRVNPQTLQRHVPFAVDPFGEDAYVSLVAFTQSRLRPARLGRAGELLSAPLACHEFLNLRTYVRHEGEPGIFFLSEWIPNRLAVLIGPRLYGLPYRLGRLDYRFDHLHQRLAGHVESQGASLGFGGWSGSTTGFGEALPGSLEHFLVERYRAWTSRAGVSRRFAVRHEPWRMARLAIELRQRDLLDRAAPWLSGTPVACAHYSPGVRDVSISAPVKIETGTNPVVGCSARRRNAGMPCV
jgi:uncharacterized protein YqjF (DUF2071 family)